MMAKPADVSASPSGGLVSGGALARSGSDRARASALSPARLFFLAANLTAGRLARDRFDAEIRQPVFAGTS